MLVVRIHAFSRLHAHTALMRVNLCRRHVDVEAGVGNGGGNLAGDIFCQLGVCADISSLVDFAWLGSRGVVALLAAGAEWAAFLRGAGRDVFGNYPR